MNVIKDLSVVFNVTTAQAMASSTEIQDYLKQSPVALQQVRGDVENQNGIWGLPTILYTLNLVVEDAVRVSINKNPANDLTVLPGFVMPDGIAYMLARQGKLEGLAGSRSYSTVQCFFYRDEMTAETMYEQIHKRYLGRVISNYVPVIASTFSGFSYYGVLDYTGGTGPGT